MRIVSLQTFRADGGWRPFSFLRIETDAGLAGWSEFAEAAWAPGLVDVIRALGTHVIGADPRAWAVISARLSSASVEARPPGWITRLPINAMNLYGSSAATSRDDNLSTPHSDLDGSGNSRTRLNICLANQLFK